MSPCKNFEHRAINTRPRTRSGPRATSDWPPGSDEERAEFLLRLAAERGLQGWVLLPTDDDAVAVVARHHDRLGGVFQLTTPPWNQLRNAVDKRLLYCLAASLGVDQ